MKKFILYIAVGFTIYLLLLEGTTRLFDLSGHTIPESNLNNNRLATPNSEGIWVKGGMREIASHYKINQQGFNSVKDYTTLDKHKIKVAIVGDSYIEGFHSDVENSIGRQLEKASANQIEVHEYGKAGGNIVDFNLMFTQWIKDRYDYIFILVTNKDIVQKRTSFMGRGNTVLRKSLVREIYNSSSTLRYLNINHGLNKKLQNLFSPVLSDNNTVKNLQYADINTSALEQFDDSCIFIYEDGKLTTDYFDDLGLSYLEIVHDTEPINHGFDSHWNQIGRKNCALTIKKYIDQIERK